GVRAVNSLGCPCDSTSPANRESSLLAGQSAGQSWSPAALPENPPGRQPLSPATSQPPEPGTSSSSPSPQHHRNGWVDNRLHSAVANCDCGIVIPGCLHTCHPEAALFRRRILRF